MKAPPEIDRMITLGSGGANRAVLLGRVGVLVVLLLAWQLASTTSDLIPPIGDTADALADGLFGDGAMLGQAWYTLRIVLLGFAISVVLGGATGLLLGLSRFWGDVLEPVFTALFVIPRILLYPAILAIAGIGAAAELWLAVVAAYFPVAIETMVGMRNVSTTLRRLGRSLGASRVQVLTKILLPAALPTIMVGVRVCFSSAFILVVIAEMFASADGLGRELSISYTNQNYPAMFAVVVLICVVALAGNFALFALERKARAAID